MNMDDWRQNANERLEALTGTVRQMTPGVLYGALCSSTLLPVITAANQGRLRGSILRSLGVRGRRRRQPHRQPDSGVEGPHGAGTGR